MLSLNSSAFCQDKKVIQEFTIERTACFGPCPVYKATIRSDRVVTYVGIENVTKLGTFKGDANPYMIKHLSEMTRKINFFNLKSEYTSEMTDQSAAITSALRGDTRKTIRNYGMAGPSLLWAFENSLDAVIASVNNWTQVEGKKVD